MTGYRTRHLGIAGSAAGARPAEFRVLGPFEVTALGKPVPVPAAERILLHVLFLFWGQPYAQDLLFTALRGSSWPADPAAALQSYAARAARAVSPWAGITVRSGLYQASAQAATVDLNLFRRRRTQASAAAACGNLPAAAASLTGALGCWRAPVIPRLPAVLEVHTEAIGLLEERHIAGHDLAALQLRPGWHQQALPALRARAVTEPGCGQATAQLMTALLRSGRPYEAFGAYRTLRRWLAAEQGIHPGPDVQALLDQVLTGAPRPVGPRRPRHRASCANVKGARP